MNAITNFIDRIKTDVEGVFEAHAGEAQTVLADAASVFDNPLAQAAAALEHIPGSWLTGLANGLLDLDHELGRIKAAIAAEAPAPAAADPTTGSGTTFAAPGPVLAATGQSGATSADASATLSVGSPEAQANAPA